MVQGIGSHLNIRLDLFSSIRFKDLNKENFLVSLHAAIYWSDRLIKNWGPPLIVQLSQICTKLVTNLFWDFSIFFWNFIISKGQCFTYFLGSTVCTNSFEAVTSDSHPTVETEKFLLQKLRKSVINLTWKADWNRNQHTARNSHSCSNFLDTQQPIFLHFIVSAKNLISFLFRQSITLWAIHLSVSNGQDWHHSSEI